MKYWRGYLVAGIFAAFTWALMQLGKSLGTVVDMIYPYISRVIQTTLAQWSGGVDFCLWQIAALVLLVLLLASIVLMIVFRWNPIQWFGWVLTVVCAGFFLHTAIYGLNQYAGPLAEDIRLEQTEFTLADLENATIYFRDQANTLAGRMPRDGEGRLEFDDFEALADQAANGFENLTYEEFDAVFAGSTLPVKKLAWGDLYTSMGITGVTMPLTGEAGVNPNIPAVSMPFTMCHEMCHRMSIASERDANFGAFLASLHNDDPQFQYSAWFMAYRYCIAALAGVGTSQASQDLAKIRAEESDAFRGDLQAYNEYFQSRRNEKAEKVADTVNNAYLKTSGDAQGTLSYGEVYSLLVDWHLQEIVKPQREAEEPVIRFNPFTVDPYAPLETEPEAATEAP